MTVINQRFQLSAIVRSINNQSIKIVPNTFVLGSLGDISFNGYSDDNIVRNYYPSLPINFEQFASGWLSESLEEICISKGIPNRFHDILYRGISYPNTHSFNSYDGYAGSILNYLVRYDSDIETDFDTNFDKLVTSITSLSSLINTAFSSQNLALQAITTALNNLQINIGDVDIAGVDDIVTQLQNLYTINASQNANLSQLSQLANIVSAIANKDNQSDVVDILKTIFVYETQNAKESVFKYQGGINLTSNQSRSTSIPNLFRSLIECFLTGSLGVGSNPVSINLNSKLFTNLLALNGYQNDDMAQVPNNVNLNITSSVFKQIRDKIQNIETKLENNLPFTTLNDITLNVDTVKKNCITELKDKDI